MTTDKTRAQSRNAIRPKAETLRVEVLKFIARQRDGATDEEIQRGLGMTGNTQRPRRKELEKAGAIVAEGTRKTSSGRAAAVWRIAPPPDSTGQLPLFAETKRDRWVEHLNDH